MSERVQFPLTLFIPIIPGPATDALREKFKTNNTAGGALGATELVHFARLFVFEEGNPMGIPANIAAVITSYDGNFDAYVQAFVNFPGTAEFFDQVLSIADIPGAKDLIPVKKNAQKFAELVAKYDATNVQGEPWGSWFSAYPGATVPNIQDALKQEG